LANRINELLYTAGFASSDKLSNEDKGCELALALPDLALRRVQRKTHQRMATLSSRVRPHEEYDCQASGFVESTVETQLSCDWLYGMTSQGKCCNDYQTDLKSKDRFELD
jgi:hypothetical protein